MASLCEACFKDFPSRSLVVKACNGLMIRAPR